MFSFENFSFSPSHSPVMFDRPMVIQQAPKIEMEHGGIEKNIQDERQLQQQQPAMYQQQDEGVAVRASANHSGPWGFPVQVKTEPVEMENWENTFHMRLFNLSSFPSAQTTYRSSHRSQSLAIQKARMGFISSTPKSLEILRQTLQKNINKELDEVIKKYIEKFFRPAIENIKRNNGANSVSEEHVQTVCKQMLEEAKKMYITSHTRGSTPLGEYSDSETGSLAESQGKFGRPFTRSPQLRKRKDSDTDSEASQIPIKQPKRKGRPPLYLTGGASGRSTPSKHAKNEPVKREGPKWNPERLTKDSIFVMGARANKALGFGQTRGRLYSKHPEIFKYCGDSEDKQWLHDNNLMPATGGRAYMLLLEDIKELAETEEYRNSPVVMLDELVGFRAPDNMLTKMRICMNAMRTDIPGRKHRGRPFASIENTAEIPTIEQPFDVKTEPVSSLLPDFSTASPASTNSAVKRMDLESSVPGSPVDDLDLRDGDPSPGQQSPFLVPIGLEDASPADVSPSASELNAVLETSQDPPLSAPFTIDASP